MDGRLPINLVNQRSVYLGDFICRAAVSRCVHIGFGVVFSRPVGRAGCQLTAKISVTNFLSVGQIMHDVSYPVDGNGKASPFHVGSNCCINTNYLAAFHVDQWAAGISRIDGCVGLYVIHEFVGNSYHHGRSFPPRNNAHRDRVVQAPRTSHSNHDFPNFQLVAVSQFCHRQVRYRGTAVWYNFQNGNIYNIVCPRYDAAINPAIGQGDFDFSSAFNNVCIGQNESFRRKDQTGSLTLLNKG
mmetsp:Transcript_13831/g.29059  ORF Transcript_13831/g.29059 Transcript_13831/m.29059 type:complete len:242 (+) Transcript_13831:498-1223(+)